MGCNVIVADPKPTESTIDSSVEMGDVSSSESEGITVDDTRSSSSYESSEEDEVFCLVDGEYLEAGETLYRDGCEPDVYCSKNGDALEATDKCMPEPCSARNSKTYYEGDSYSDGCNTHRCIKGGKWVSTERNCPEMFIECDDVWEPVCSVNGNTYPNECEAKRKLATVFKNGECAPTNECIELYAPVCGTNGKTYSTQCEAENNFINVAYGGECTEEPNEPKEPVVCTKEVAPVCGYDNVTYDNACIADKEGAYIKNTGECGEAYACTAIYDPVCGVDGKTYGSSCSTLAPVLHKGECEASLSFKDVTTITIKEIQITLQEMHIDYPERTSTLNKQSVSLMLPDDRIIRIEIRYEFDHGQKELVAIYETFPPHWSIEKKYQKIDLGSEGYEAFQQAYTDEEELTHYIHDCDEKGNCIRLSHTPTHNIFVNYENTIISGYYYMSMDYGTFISKPLSVLIQEYNKNVKELINE